MRVLSFISSIVMILCVFTSCKKKDEIIKEPEFIDEGCELLIRANDSVNNLVLAKLMENSNNEKSENDYSIDVGSVDDIVMNIALEGYDIAIVPTNAAYAIYQAGNTDMKILGCINPSSLKLIAYNSDISDISQLDGKDIYYFDDGGMLLYIAQYIIDTNDIEANLICTNNYDDILKMIDDHKEVIGIFENIIIPDGGEINTIIDLNEEWKKLSANEFDVPMNVVIVNSKFANANPYAVKYFIEELSFATDYTNKNYDEVFELISKNNLKITINNNGMTGFNYSFIKGNEMKEQLLSLTKFISDNNLYELPAFSNDIYYLKDNISK